MDDVASLWHQGGFGMFPILLLFLGGLGTGVAAVVFGLAQGDSRRALVAGGASLGVGLVAMGLGLAFEQLGLQRAREAVDAVNPADKEIIWAAVRSEVLVTRLFGTLAGLVPISGGILGLVAGLAPSRRAVGALGAAAWLVCGGLLFSTQNRERARLAQLARGPMGE